MKKAQVLFDEFYDLLVDDFQEGKKNGLSYTDVEDITIDGYDGFGYLFTESEVDRMLCFVAIAIIEINGEGLTEGMFIEMEYDIPVWEMGEIYKFIPKKDWGKTKSYVCVIKKYCEEHFESVWQ